MGLFEHFPYTNFHSLNIQWAIEKIKELLQQGETLYSQLEDWKTDTDTELGTLTESVNQAIEDVENLSEQVTTDLASAYRQFSTLTAENDLNDVHNPGGYRWTGSNIPANSPTTTAAALFVIRCGSLVSEVQIVISAGNVLSHRYRTSASWTAWKRELTTTDLDTTLSESEKAADAKTVGDTISALSATAYKQYSTLNSETDLNDIHNPGGYRWTGSNVPANAPISAASALFIIRSGSSVSEVQIVVTAGNRIYLRYHTSTAWTPWNYVITDANYLSLPYSLNMLSAQGLGIVKAANNLQLSSRPTGNVSYYTEGTEHPVLNANTAYTGVAYLPAHYDSRDTLFNFNLESYFSMLKNPESLMYTYQGTHGWTGSVCSSVGSWFAGLPIFFTTYDLAKLLTFKPMASIYELEIGDLVLCSTTWGGGEDHCIFVETITVQNGAVSSVGILEGWSPTSRRATYTPEQFMGLLNGTTRAGKIYKVGRAVGYTPRVASPIEVVSDIIPERGNKCYYKVGEPVYIKSTSVNITVTAPDGTQTLVNATSLPLKTGSTILRDFSSILNSTGKWSLTGETREKTEIAIIDTGHPSLALQVTENSVTGTIHPSGHVACAPVGFAIVKVMSGQHGAYEPHISGDYSATRLTIYSGDDWRYAGAMTDADKNVNLTDVNTNTSYPALYVYARVFYDTGFGQAYEDTPLQQFPQ